MTEQHARPSTWRLFLTWATIGLQSFGGGASTLLLVQRAFIERTGWMSKEEYLRLWSLCQITPGITLIAFTALIGQKLGGARGVVISLAGMLLPSSAITCLLAALFLQVERSTTTQAALRGIIPATGGVMILVLYNFMQPLISKSRQMGMLASVANVTLTLLCAALVIVFNVSAIILIVGLALLGAVAFAPRKRPADTPRDTPGDTPTDMPAEDAQR